MTSSAEICVPEIITDPKNAKDILRNDIIDFLKQHNLGWKKTVADSIGKNFVKLLADVLWHVTSHFEHFENRGSKISECFDTFRDRDNFKYKKKVKPALSSEYMTKCNRIFVY